MMFRIVHEDGPTRELLVHAMSCPARSSGERLEVPEEELQLERETLDGRGAEKTVTYGSVGQVLFESLLPQPETNVVTECEEI